MNTILPLFVFWNLPLSVISADKDGVSTVPKMLSDKQVLLTNNAASNHPEDRTKRLPRLYAAPSNELGDVMTRNSVFSQLIPLTKQSQQAYKVRTAHDSGSRRDAYNTGTTQRDDTEWGSHAMARLPRRTAGASKRRTRSVAHDDVAIIEEIVDALRFHRNDPEFYNELIAFIREVQRQITNNEIPPNQNSFLKNMLKSFMKRRFNSWGGKRDSEEDMSGFYSWGGRKKKSTGDSSAASLLHQREVRNFNPWGGKRDVVREVYGPGNLVEYREHTEQHSQPGPLRPPNRLFINMELGLDKARKASQDMENRKLLHDERLLRYLQPLDHKPEDYTGAINHGIERKSFSTWGGKRNGFTSLGHGSDIRAATNNDDLASITLETSKDEIKRETFNQWGGK